MRFKLLSPLRNVVFELTHPKRGSSQPQNQNVTVFNQLRDTRTQTGYSGYSGILGDSGILGLDGQEQRMSGQLCLVLVRLDKQTTDRISSKSADRMLTADPRLETLDEKMRRTNPLNFVISPSQYTCSHLLYSLIDTTSKSC